MMTSRILSRDNYLTKVTAACTTLERAEEFSLSSHRGRRGLGRGGSLFVWPARASVGCPSPRSFLAGRGSWPCRLSRGLLSKRAASVAAILLLLSFLSLSASARKIPAGFSEHFAEVNGVRLHYFIGGKGSPVVLLHGYAETSHMWLPVMPPLAKSHTVIVPDLRGAGDSSKPESGYDKKNMAVDIHELTSSLGIKRASIVGHDIGLMVAYAYAAQFPDA